jgi:hypothetical protein
MPCDFRLCHHIGRCNNISNNNTGGRKNRISQARALFPHVAGTPINLPRLRETNGLFPVFVVPETYATRKLFGSELPAQAQPFPQATRRCVAFFALVAQPYEATEVKRNAQSRLEVGEWLATGQRRVVMTRRACE